MFQTYTYPHEDIQRHTHPNGISFGRWEDKDYLYGGGYRGGSIIFRETQEGLDQQAHHANQVEMCGCEHNGEVHIH